MMLSHDEVSFRQKKDTFFLHYASIPSLKSVKKIYK